MRCRAARSVLLVLLGGGVLLSPWMGAIPLLDQDEPRFAECSRQMLVTGDWLYPQFNGRPRHAKPPLFNWVQATFYRALGVSELSARLPSLLATITTGLVLYLFTAAHRGHASGMLALLVWFALPQTHLWARMSVVDPLLTVATTLALVAAFNGLQGTAFQRWQWYGLAGVAMGLAVMIKGPVGVAVPALAYLLYALASRAFRRALGHAGPWVALVLAVAIAAPWFAAQVAHYGREYTDTFFGFDNVQRYAKPRDSLGPVGWLWPAPVVLLFAFPVSVLIPGAIHGALRRRSQEREGEAAASWRLYLAVWIIAVAGLFAFSATRLPQYFMALYPAVAMLIGEALPSPTTGEDWHRGRGVAVAVLVVGALLAIAFGYGASRAAEWVPKAKLDNVPLMAAVAGALAVAFAVGGLLAPPLWRLARPRTAVAGLLGAGLLVSLVIGNVVWPAVGLTRDQGKKELSLLCRQSMEPGVPIIAYGLHTSTVVFYSHHVCLEVEKRKPAALLAAIHAHPRTRVIMHRMAWPEVSSGGLKIVAKSRQYVLAQPGGGGPETPPAIPNRASRSFTGTKAYGIVQELATTAHWER